MTYTHIACTNSDGNRVIQPFSPLDLSFVERKDGRATAIYYIDGKAVSSNVRESFSDILEVMVSVGAAIDCTEGKKYDPNYGSGAAMPERFLHFKESGPSKEILYPAPEIVENLQKQLAAKDNENAELRQTAERFKIVSAEVYEQCEKLGIFPKSATFGVKALSDEIWNRQTEIHRLNAEIGRRNRKISDLENALQECGLNKSQTEPPDHALSDEMQGIKGDGVTGD